VEYDNSTGMWVAVQVGTGVVIAKGSVRAEVIAAEVAWLEERL